MKHYYMNNFKQYFNKIKFKKAVEIYKMQTIHLQNNKIEMKKLMTILVKETVGDAVLFAAQYDLNCSTISILQSIIHT